MVYSYRIRKAALPKAVVAVPNGRNRTKQASPPGRRPANQLKTIPEIKLFVASDKDVKYIYLPMGNETTRKVIYI